MKTLAIRSDFDFRFFGFRVLTYFNSGFRLLGLQGFRLWKVKNASPTQGFEYVKGYAGSDAGKRGVCSEHGLSENAERPHAVIDHHNDILLLFLACENGHKP